MDDDEFGADADFLAALAATDTSTLSQPRIQQPTPQRLDARPPSAAASSSAPKVVQPTPQALPGKASSGSAIFVSHRQKGNPILAHLRSQPWEWRDIPADYVLGATTCALFLSLKYHRLHPEYVYGRIRGLAGKYRLRVLLAMVDIPNHEEALRELSKTSLVNDVTVVLCWSAAEGARYLELYKSFEHAAPSAITGVQPRSYGERFVEFVTVPRGINKGDAVGIVSAFGSVRAAVNARPEEVAVLSGWGEKKVRRWTEVVREPFRARKAARRGVGEGPGAGAGEEQEGEDREAVSISRVPLRGVGAHARDESRERTPKEPEAPQLPAVSCDKGKERETQPEEPPKKPFEIWEPQSDSDAEEALTSTAAEEEERLQRNRRAEQKRKDDELSGGVAAALAKLRKQ